MTNSIKAIVQDFRIHSNIYDGAFWEYSSRLNVPVRIRGYEILVFRKILRTH